MKNIFILTLFLTIIISCKTKKEIQNDSILLISIDTLLVKKMSCRAIAISNQTLFYAANQNRVGYINLETNEKNEITVKNDSTNLEFRSLAINNNQLFVMNIASPANLYKISTDLKTTELVYSENHPKVFYDSMQFSDALNGIAMGDPIEDCLAIITTSDGGNSWQKKPCSQLPKTVDGEAAFAASNTNCIVKNKNTWLVSGGKKARIFYSKDWYKTWNVFETPIIQGETMTGIFSADFYDQNNGIIAGGNYEVPKLNQGNKAITNDGGKTWQTFDENSGLGIVSCVQYFPSSKAKKLISVGANGIFCSNDKGITWKQLSSDNSFYTIRFLNATTAIAAGKDKIVRLIFKN